MTIALVASEGTATVTEDTAASGISLAASLASEGRPSRQGDERAIVAGVAPEEGVEVKVGKRKALASEGVAALPSGLSVVGDSRAEALLQCRRLALLQHPRKRHRRTPSPSPSVSGDTASDDGTSSDDSHQCSGERVHAREKWLQPPAAGASKSGRTRTGEAFQARIPHFRGKPRAQAPPMKQ